VPTESHASVGLPSAWPALASGVSSTTGHCLRVDSLPTADGWTTLEHASADGVVGPQLPSLAGSGHLVGTTFAVSLLACLHRLPTVQVANGEYDTSVLPLPVELYLGGLWFAMFVSTPYLGTYSCATTGVCHWGSLSVPFARVSFFRLRVRDRSVCQRCTKLDCAKACPVGLVDMPFYLRTPGEFRSTKCVGVGDCVGACPYGNLYDQDVCSRISRVLVRRRRDVSSPRLPMATAARAPPPASAGPPA